MMEKITMDHLFRLHIGKERLRLVLLGGGEEIATREWEESRDMGRRLFEAIESVLEETGIGSRAVTGFDVVTDISESFTSVRIGESVAKAWIFASGA